MERLLRTRRALGKIAARPQLSGGSGVGIESACQLTIYIYIIMCHVYMYHIRLTDTHGPRHGLPRRGGLDLAIDQPSMSGYHGAPGRDWILAQWTVLE